MISHYRAEFCRKAAVGIAAAFSLQFAAPLANGVVIYSGLQDIAIPTDFSGVYLNLDNGTTSSVEFVGWDVNPFFGGFGFGNSASFQPARTGAGNEDPILPLAFGRSVGGNLTFSIGQGGSGSHFGTGSNHFKIGHEAYLGFRFSTDGNAGPYYGWMRVIFTANLSGGILKDWAYETSGAPTQTGNVLQTPDGITLSGDASQYSTLGPLPGISSLNILKTGAGTWNLTEPANYTSLVTSGGRTSVHVSLTDAAVTAGPASTIEFDGDQTLASLTIGDDGTVAFSESVSSSPPLELAAPFASGPTSVPEPRAAALLASALAMMLARTRRRSAR